MSPAIYQRLLQEAVDHLEIDDVGIYEILWIARGSEFKLDDVTAKKITRRVVNQLLSDGTANLILLKWPTNEVTCREPRNVDLTTDSIFEPSQDNEYLALTIDNAPSNDSTVSEHDNNNLSETESTKHSSLDLP